MALFLVLHPRRLVDEETGRPDLGLHVRELERYRLALGYGLPEGSSPQSIPRGVTKRRFGYADRLGGYADPTRIQRAERDAEPSSFLPQSVLFRDEDVVEEHVVGGGGDHAHLLCVLAEGDTLGVHPEDEGR